MSRSESSLTVSSGGESVTISLELARRFCPEEVAALQATRERLTQALQRNDSAAAERVGREMEECANALVQALGRRARELRQDEGAS